MTSFYFFSAFLYIYKLQFCCFSHEKTVSENNTLKCYNLTLEKVNTNPLVQ